MVYDRLNMLPEHFNLKAVTVKRLLNAPHTKHTHALNPKKGCKSNAFHTISMRFVIAREIGRVEMFLCFSFGVISSMAKIEHSTNQLFCSILHVYWMLLSTFNWNMAAVAYFAREFC